MKSGLAAFALLIPPAAALSNLPVSAIVERNKLVVMKAYPSRSLKRGEEGTVAFVVQIDRNGRLDGCQVTSSSGFPALDQATCEMLLAGATATPLRAEDGWRTAGRREGIVEWRLPVDARRPAVAPVPTATGAGDKIICRRQTKSGSTFMMEKVCLTKADWDRQEAYAREDLMRKQMPTGPLQM